MRRCGRWVPYWVYHITKIKDYKSRSSAQIGRRLVLVFSDGRVGKHVRSVAPLRMQVEHALWQQLVRQRSERGRHERRPLCAPTVHGERRHWNRCGRRQCIRRYVCDHRHRSMSMNRGRRRRCVSHVGISSHRWDHLGHHKQTSIVDLDRSLHGQLWHRRQERGRHVQLDHERRPMAIHERRWEIVRWRQHERQRWVRRMQRTENQIQIKLVSIVRQTARSRKNKNQDNFAKKENDTRQLNIVHRRTTKKISRNWFGTQFQCFCLI